MCAELATIRDYKVGQESRSIAVVNGGPLGTNVIGIQNYAAAKSPSLLWRSAHVVPQMCMTLRGCKRRKHETLKCRGIDSAGMGQ
jgi:hypothetical protein